MGGESCTVLRLRLMRKLAMPHMDRPLNILYLNFSIICQHRESLYTPVTLIEYLMSADVH